MVQFKIIKIALKYVHHRSTHHIHSMKQFDHNFLVGVTATEVCPLR